MLNTAENVQHPRKRSNTSEQRSLLPPRRNHHKTHRAETTQDCPPAKSTQQRLNKCSTPWKTLAPQETFNTVENTRSVGQPSARKTHIDATPQDKQDPPSQSTQDFEKRSTRQKTSNTVENVHHRRKNRSPRPSPTHAKHTEPKRPKTPSMSQN